MASLRRPDRLPNLRPQKRAIILGYFHIWYNYTNMDDKDGMLRNASLDVQTIVHIRSKY
jgi:hypothetical protein